MKGLDRFKNGSVAVKATLAFGIASFAASGINYITTPIFTRLLSTTDYGVIAVYNSWYEIIRVFATLTLVFPGILQVGLYEHSDNRWKYLSSILGIITSVTLVMGAIYAVFRRPINNFVGLGTSLIVLMLLVCIFQTSTTLWTTKHRYEYNYKIPVLIAVGSAVLAQIVSVAAVILLKNVQGINLANVRLWSAGIVNIIVGLVLYIYMVSKGRKPVDFPLWKATAIVAIPLIPHYISSVILHSTDKIMIGQMVGNDKAGIYSLAATLSSIGVLFWRALSTTFSPFVNSKLGERKFKDINDSVLPLVTVVGLTCLLGALAAPEVIRILATEKYMEGIYVIPPVVVGILLHSLYDVFSAVAFFHKKSTRIMIASVVAALTNVVLNYICIKEFGFIAAGYTTMISNFVLTAMHYFNMRRIEPEKIYDIKYLVLMVLIISGCCMFCNVLYNLANIIRYAFIVLVVAVIISQRKRLIKAINNMKV